MRAHSGEGPQRIASLGLVLAVVTMSLLGTEAWVPQQVSAQTLNQYPLPPGDPDFHTPQRIAVGPDGAVWFTEQSGYVGRITINGQVTEYPVPDAGGIFSGIVAGPDGALWFTAGNRIGRISTAGAVTVYGPPSTDSLLWDIVVGPDGALWFVDEGPFRWFNSDPRIGRITLDGQITEFRGLGIASQIITGSDGALWIAGGDKITRLTTDGHIAAQYPIPLAGGSISALTLGPDGAFWFLVETNNQIGQLTTDGVITLFGIPTSLSIATSITTGPDGALWFTEYAANKLGRITTTGVITEFDLGGTQNSPYALVTGPDRALWFTERRSQAIGRYAPAGSTPAPTLTLTIRPPTMTSGIPAPTPTQIAPGTMGGKNIGIVPGGAGASTILWDAGALQNGYLVARTIPSLEVLAPGLQPASVTSLRDNSPAGAPPGTPFCYMVGPTAGTPPTLAGYSNVACELAQTRSPAGAPQGFTLHVTQANNAVLNWRAPTGNDADSYRIISLSGASSVVELTTESVTWPLTGFDCFMVLAQRHSVAQGNTDIACGLAGVSNLGP